MDKDFARRLENWSQYNRWEARQPPVNWTFQESLEWMGRAIYLARQTDPEWGLQKGMREHCHYLSTIRERLGKLRPHG